MKIVDNNVKCGKTITFDHKLFLKIQNFYTFCTLDGAFVNNRVLKRKSQWPGDYPGGGGGDGNRSN